MDETQRREITDLALKVERFPAGHFVHGLFVAYLIQTQNGLEEEARMAKDFINYWHRIAE